MHGYTSEHTWPKDLPLTDFEIEPIVNNADGSTTFSIIRAFDPQKNKNYVIKRVRIQISYVLG